MIAHAYAAAELGFVTKKVSIYLLPSPTTQPVPVSPEVCPSLTYMREGKGQLSGSLQTIHLTWDPVVCKMMWPDSMSTW